MDISQKGFEFTINNSPEILTQFNEQIDIQQMEKSRMIEILLQKTSCEVIKEYFELFFEVCYNKLLNERLNKNAIEVLKKILNCESLKYVFLMTNQKLLQTEEGGNTSDHCRKYQLFLFYEKYLTIEKLPVHLKQILQFFQIGIKIFGILYEQKKIQGQQEKQQFNLLIELHQNFLRQVVLHLSKCKLLQINQIHKFLVILFDKPLFQYSNDLIEGIKLLLRVNNIQIQQISQKQGPFFLFHLLLKQPFYQYLYSKDARFYHNFCILQKHIKNPDCLPILQETLTILNTKKQEIQSLNIRDKNFCDFIYIVLQFLGDFNKMEKEVQKNLLKAVENIKISMKNKELLWQYVLDKAKNNDFKSYCLHQYKQTVLSLLGIEKYQRRIKSVLIKISKEVIKEINKDSLELILELLNFIYILKLKSKLSFHQKYGGDGELIENLKTIQSKLKSQLELQKEASTSIVKYRLESILSQ